MIATDLPTSRKSCRCFGKKLPGGWHHVCAAPYTAMGDAVNVASRLEGCTGASGVGILVGEVTRNRAKDVVFREIDRIRVKGKGRL